MRSCSKCGVDKDTSEFHKHSGMKDGLSPSCKACKSLVSKAYREKPEVQRREKERLHEYYRHNREKIDQKKKEYLEKPGAKEKQREYSRKSHSKPEVHKKSLERQAQYRKTEEYQNRKKDLRLRQKYGITLEQYNQMHAQQNHCCAVCKKHQSHFKNSLAVDHNHRTGKVRALLCFHCNRMKVAKHTIESAKAVYEYLVTFDDPEKKSG